MSIPKNWECLFSTKGGIKVKAYIPPYVWMYEGGRIREVIVQDERGCEIRVNTKLTMADSTPEQLEMVIKEFAYPEGVCKTCTSPMLAREGYYRTTDECEVCAKERITEEFKKEREKEEFKEKVRDTAHKAQGYRYKTIMWVHPNNGGDDYQLVIYSLNKPTDADTVKFLKQKRSSVTNDYTIKEL